MAFLPTFVWWCPFSSHFRLETKLKNDITLILVLSYFLKKFCCAVLCLVISKDQKVRGNWAQLVPCHWHILLQTAVVDHQRGWGKMIMSNNKAGRNTSCLKASVPGLLSQLIIFICDWSWRPGNKEIRYCLIPRPIREQPLLSHSVSESVSPVRSNIACHAAVFSLEIANQVVQRCKLP